MIIKFAEFKVSSDNTEYFDKSVLMELVEKLGTKLLVLKCMIPENLL